MEDDAGTRTVLVPAPGRVLGSDPHDFAGLYIRHRTSFTSHARRYLRDPRDADEVVQEAFLRLFLAMPELETELQALAYCRRTITNLCIDRYRADARRPRLVALEGAPVEDLAEDDTGDPVVRAEDAALVREALSKLPELHRAALVMREIEEKPLPLIADELDVPEDSVKHLLFRARRALRKLLAGTSVAPGVDAELTRGLRPLTRGASGGVAGLLLLALLALGSGPDLRAVPVVGVDLPDVLGVTAVADAVRDVVGAIVPGQAPADAATGDRSSRPVSRSEALAPAQAPPPGTAAAQPAQPEGGTAAVGTSRPGPATAQPGLPSSGATTMVTVVDGLPVVTVVPPTDVLTPAYGPATEGRATAPGTSTGLGAGQSLPTPLVPLPLTAGRDVPVGTPVGPAVPVGTPVGPAVPVADVPARPGGSDVPGRSPRADDVVHEAADRPADTAQRLEKAAEKAAGVADKAEAKAVRAEQRAAVKSEHAVAKAAERAADKGAGRAAAKAADKAARAAEKAASARGAEVAAALAAERAAAAQQAATAAVPVDAVVTVPAP